MSHSETLKRIENVYADIQMKPSLSPDSLIGIPITLMEAVDLHEALHSGEHPESLWIDAAGGLHLHKARLSVATNSSLTDTEPAPPEPKVDIQEAALLAVLRNSIDAKREEVPVGPDAMKLLSQGIGGGVLGYDKYGRLCWNTNLGSVRVVTESEVESEPAHWAKMKAWDWKLTRLREGLYWRDPRQTDEEWRPLADSDAKRLVDAGWEWLEQGMWAPKDSRAGDRCFSTGGALRELDPDSGTTVEPGKDASPLKEDETDPPVHWAKMREMRFTQGVEGNRNWLSPGTPGKAYALTDAEAKLLVDADWELLAERSWVQKSGGQVCAIDEVLRVLDRRKEADSETPRARPIREEIPTTPIPELPDSAITPGEDPPPLEEWLPTWMAPALKGNVYVSNVGSGSVEFCFPANENGRAIQVLAKAMADGMKISLRIEEAEDNREVWDREEGCFVPKNRSNSDPEDNAKTYTKA